MRRGKGAARCEGVCGRGRGRLFTIIIINIITIVVINIITACRDNAPPPHSPLLPEWSDVANDWVSKNTDINLDDYPHKVYVVVKGDTCEWGGMGYVGCSDDCRAWINGDLWDVSGWWGEGESAVIIIITRCHSITWDVRGWWGEGELRSLGCERLVGERRKARPLRCKWWRR